MQYADGLTGVATATSFGIMSTAEQRHRRSPMVRGQTGPDDDDAVAVQCRREQRVPIDGRVQRRRNRLGVKTSGPVFKITAYW